MNEEAINNFEVAVCGALSSGGVGAYEGSDSAERTREEEKRMKRLRCIFGMHDFYAVFMPLILQSKEATPYQYMTVKRICMMPDCKKKEEFIIQLSGKLQDWDVLLSAPNFVSEELRRD